MLRGNRVPSAVVEPLHPGFCTKTAYRKLAGGAADVVDCLVAGDAESKKVLKDEPPVAETTRDAPHRHAPGCRTAAAFDHGERGMGRDYGCA